MAKLHKQPGLGLGLGQMQTDFLRFQFCVIDPWVSCKHTQPVKFDRNEMEGSI